LYRQGPRLGVLGVNAAGGADWALHGPIAQVAQIFSQHGREEGRFRKEGIVAIGRGQFHVLAFDPSFSEYLPHLPLLLNGEQQIFSNTNNQRALDV
jgi:hypothetical protein